MIIGSLSGVALQELWLIRTQLQEDLKRVDAAIGENDPHNLELRITVSTGDKDGIKYLVDLAESCIADVSSIGGDIRLLEQPCSGSNDWDEVTLLDLRTKYKL